MKKILFIISLIASLHSLANTDAPYFCVQSIDLMKFASKVDTFVAVGDGYTKQEAYQNMKRKSAISLNACKLKSKKIGATSWCYKTQIQCHENHPQIDWDDMFR